MSVHPIWVTLVIRLASAQAPSYEAEIDCGGVFQAGDAVPFTVLFEELAFRQHTVDVQVGITPPGGNRIRLVEQTFVLGSSRQLSFTRSVDLPPNAPAGVYDMDLRADDGTLVVTDGCELTVAG